MFVLKRQIPVRSCSLLRGVGDTLAPGAVSGGFGSRAWRRTLAPPLENTAGSSCESVFDPLQNPENTSDVCLR